MSNRRQSKRALVQEESEKENTIADSLNGRECETDHLKRQRVASTQSKKEPLCAIEQPNRFQFIRTLNDLKSENPDLYSSFLTSCVNTLAQYGWVSHISPNEYAQELFHCLVCKASVQDPKSYSLPPKLDMGWHALILETQDYIHLCQFITDSQDGMIHHSTRTANDSSALKNWRIDNLMKLYITTIKSHPNPWCWKEDPVVRNLSTSQESEQIESQRNKQSSGAVIYVKTLTGKPILVPYNGTDTVVSVKGQILQVEGIPVGQQRIIYAGRQLEDHRTLLDYNIQKGASLDLILSLTGC